MRHTTLTLDKRGKWYEDIRPSFGGSDFNPLAASAGFCAFVDQHGHGAVVLPLNSVGKTRAHPMPAVRVGSEVRGLEWDPFCPNNLATGGADGTVKLWRIPPEGLKEDLAGPLVSLSTSTDNGDGIPAAHAVLKGLAFHKSAPGLLACRGLRKISLFDLTRPQAPCLSMGGGSTFEGDSCDFSWSYSGDVLLTTDKTRFLQLLDIRAGSVVAKANDVHGPGTSRVTWCDNSVYMLTTGMSQRTREREFAVWDARSLAAPISRNRVGGTSSGFLLPTLQYGLGLLSLCGRGDATVRLYSFDYATGKTSAVSTTAVGGVARAYAFVPRASCDVMSCEVTRLLKLCDDGIQPVSVTIPRRDKMRFHEELFPPAPGGCPSLTAPDWLGGLTLPPYLEALPHPPIQQPSSTSSTAGASATAATTTATTAGTPPAPVAASTPVVPQPEHAEPDKVVAPVVNINNMNSIELEDRGLDESEAAAEASIGEPMSGSSGAREAPANDEKMAPDLVHEEISDRQGPERPVLETSSSSSRSWRGSGTKVKLRHVFGVETKGAKPVFNLSPLLTSLDGPILAASASFWAIPWVGGGGPVFVSSLCASGKVEPDCNLVNGHRGPVNSIAFSHFRPSLMATASEDSTVKLWDLPGSCLGAGSMSADDAMADLTFNSTAARYVEFHPAADNILMTTNADHSLQLCDVAAGGDSAALTIDVHTHTINSACFNGDGSLIATTSRDGNIRIIDPRAGEVVSQGKGHEGRKTQKAAWCFRTGRQEVLATTGCSAAGHRQLCLWDPRNLSSPSSTKTVDSSNGLLLPLYCQASGMLLLAGRGGSGVKYYEVNDSDENGSSLPEAHFCHEYKASGAPLSGVALLPPQSLDVAGVEVARLLRLTCSTVEPVSFMLPRSGDLKDYFQDDVYRPVRSSEPCLSSGEWLQGGTAQDADPASYRSLCPPGMQALSARPAQVQHVPKAVIFRQQMEQREQEEKDAADMMHKMSKLANQNAAFNPNRSVAVVMGVDQPTIIDSEDEGDWSD